MAFLDETGVVDLTADIKELTDATYSAQGTIASEYSSSSAYVEDDYCFHEGLLYQCITAIAEGGESWDSSHWTEVNVGDELNELQSELTTLDSTVSGIISADPKIVKVSFSSFSTLPQSKNNAAITANHELIGYTLGTPAAQTGNWTVTTSAGSVSVSGSISGSTTLTLILGVPKTSI